MGDGEKQRVERAQGLVDQTIDEARRDDSLVVDKGLDLEEASSNVGFDRCWLPSVADLELRDRLGHEKAAGAADAPEGVVGVVDDGVLERAYQELALPRMGGGAMRDLLR